MRSINSGVKCRPAVGAAAECSSLMAYTVWYFSGSPSYPVMYGGSGTWPAAWMASSSVRGSPCSLAPTGSKRTRRPPLESSTKSTISARRTTGEPSEANKPPARYSTTLPGLRRLPGFTRHSHTCPEGVDVLTAAEQQRLGDATRGLFADEAGGHDARLVGHEQVAGLQIIDDVVEMAMFDRSAVRQRDGVRGTGGAALELAIEHEQPTRIAGLRGCLGDQLVGQVVIEIVGAHGATFHINAEQPSMIAQPCGGYAFDLRAASFAALRSSRNRARSSAASAAES